MPRIIRYPDDHYSDYLINTEGTNDDRTQIQTHQNIIPVDASSEDIGNKEEGTQTCRPLDWLGFEIIELMVLTLIGIANINVMLVNSEPCAAAECYCKVA